MPRSARIDVPGLTHHVTARGIDKRVIFLDDRDRRRFLDFTAEAMCDGRARALAWALMPNHYHLVIRTSSHSLAGIMARTNTRYAMHFNRRHERVGHLFQNRYHSAPVLDDAYLYRLIRYVVRNPLRGGLVATVSELEQYPWTSLPVLLGRRPAQFEDLSTVLAYFGNAPRAARRGLRDWIRQPEASDGFLDPLLGSGLRPALHWVADQCGVTVDAMRSNGRPRAVSDARALAAYVVCDLLGVSKLALARELGVSDAAVHKGRERGRRIARRLGLQQVRMEERPPS